MKRQIFLEIAVVVGLMLLTLGRIPTSVLAQHEGHNHSETTAAEESGDEKSQIWTCPMHPQIQEPKPGSCPICKMDLVPAAEESLTEAQMEKTAGHVDHETTAEERGGKETQIWTCSMHPQIRLARPGQCPICNMNLIPVVTDRGSEKGAAELRMSETAQKLAEVQIAEVKRMQITKEVRLVGKIDFDETKVKHITAWVPGRLDRLYVDYTGVSVNKGDHMVYLYSPQLLSAQEELLQATRALNRLSATASKLVSQSTRRSAQAAREKLKLFGLTDNQVRQIERKGVANEQITIYAPIGGVVVDKHVSEGMYVETGSKIYTIADLSHLWITLDAYESDLPWLRYGQQVEFTTRGHPGEKFHGIISFIQPFLNERTRTVQVRVNVENKRGLLKPGMFATATIKAFLSKEGLATAPSFAGKYICPMHPEIVQEAPATCPICGMNLEKAETLPFVGQASERGSPLVIPTTAALITGKRAIVYVKNPKENLYQGREIILGPRAGDHYVVKSGLRDGELVVTNGAFKIDADLQIQGKASMMSPAGSKAGGGHAHGGH